MALRLNNALQHRRALRWRWRLTRRSVNTELKQCLIYNKALSR